MQEISVGFCEPLSFPDDRGERQDGEGTTRTLATTKGVIYNGKLTRETRTEGKRYNARKGAGAFQIVVSQTCQVKKLSAELVVPAS
jgi:hypothetical protein